MKQASFAARYIRAERFPNAVQLTLSVFVLDCRRNHQEKATEPHSDNSNPVNVSSGETKYVAEAMYN